jgi:hypothetical protein
VKIDVYCSFCSLPRRVYSKNHISILEIAVFSVISMIATYTVWQEFHWSGVAIVAVLATFTELAYRLRWRQMIKCSSCGFDPFIYKKSPDEAARLVKEFIAKRQEDPAYLLSARRPVLKPIIKKVPSTGKSYGQKGYDAPN